MDYLPEIKRILADQLGLSEDEITPEKTLNELGADSLDEVEIIMAFEEEYRIDIDETEGERIKTVAEIVTALNARLPNGRCHDPNCHAGRTWITNLKGMSESVKCTSPNCPSNERGLATAPQDSGS